MVMFTGILHVCPSACCVHELVYFHAEHILQLFSMDFNDVVFG